MRLYGAVSTAYVWQFGWLKRASKEVEQDLNLYRILVDMEALLQGLIRALTGKV